MKTMKTLVLCLLVSNLALAGESIQGDSAQALSKALTRGGSIEDCGSGHCGTSVEDISCLKIKSAKSRSVCTLKVQNENGDLVPKKWVGQKASGLVETLIDIGAVNCGMQSCQGSVKSITCVHPNDPQSADFTECFIE